MSALLTALLSYAGSEILGAVVSRFGKTGGVAAAVKEVAPKAIENLPNAWERLRANLKEARRVRFGKDDDVTDEQVDAAIGGGK